MGKYQDRRLQGETGSDPWLIVGALTIIYAAAAASPYVVPIVAGSFANALHFRVEDIGYVLSGELLAIMVGAFVLYPRVPPRRLRSTLAACLAVTVAANALSAQTGSATLFIVLRFLTGLAEGIVQAGSLALGARLKRPEQGFTVIYTALTFILAAVFLGIPAIVERWGYGAALWVLAALAGGATLMVPALDQGEEDVSDVDGSLAAASTRTSALILAAWFAFIAGQYALFVYAEQIAHEIGISFDLTGLIFAIGSLATIPVPWIAGWSIQRFGLAWPVALSTLASAGAIVAFPLAAGAASFGATFLVFNAAVFFAFPLFSTLAARVDETGRVTSQLPAAQALAMVAGPVIASTALGVAHSFVLLALIACAISLFALLACLPARMSDGALQLAAVAAHPAT